MDVDALGPRDSALDHLRQEATARGGRPGPELLAVIGGVGEQVLTGLPPLRYAGAMEWTPDIVVGEVRGWLVDVLMAEGQLAGLLSTSPSIAVLRAALRRSLAHRMSDRAARTSWHRQYRRTIRLLIESDGFVAAGPHRTHAYEQGYTLRASPADAPSSAGLDAIVARLAEGPEGQPWQLRLLGPETMAATTLDRDELERFLRAALETARGWLTAGQMSEILARRFCLDRSPPPALAERSDPVLAPGDPTGELILAEVIDAVRAELRANDVALLRRWRKAVDTNKPPPGSSAQRADLAARIRGVAAQQQASPTDMATALEHVLDQLDEALVVA